MKHKLFSLLLAVVVSVGTMNAEIKNGNCGTNLTWSLNTEDSTLTISGTGVMSNYNISNNPAPWRQDSAYIKHLILEDGVTSIGTYAFYNCTNLISVSIPNSVESIGNYAFQFCSNLPFVTIPQNVTSIGKQAFRGCSGLKWFACKAVTPPTLGSDVFYGVHRKTPMFVPSASIDEYKNAAWWSEFVNYISSWGDCGDNFMWYLNTIDSTLTIQGTGAMTDYTSSSSVPWYSYRSSIKSISLPDGLTTIGGYAFSGCSGLTSVTIPNSVTSIGASAFYGCSGLTSVIIPNSVTSIGRSAFYGCSGLTSVIIPNSVTSIGRSAFSGCSGLKSVIIPNSITSIGNSAFSGCAGLTSITIPNSVTSIGQYAFDGCSNLTSVTIPNSVTSIESYAFQNCTGLTSVTIPNSVTSIRTYAFYGCSGLTSVTIGNSVTSIGDWAFSDCTSLTSVVWNAKNCSDFENAHTPFYYYNELYDFLYDLRSQITSFTFGNEVEHIPAYLCSGMSNLTSIVIPNSVTSIGEWAFAYCSGLTSVTIEAEIPPTLGSWAFSGTTYCPIYVPCGTLDAYKTAWSNYASRIQYGPLEYHITGNVNIEGSGNVQLPQNKCEDVILISAAPNYGYHFVRWNDGNTDNPRTIVLASDTSFTAEFAKNTYTISTTSANPEWGTTAGGKSALYLDKVEISATANYGYHFVHWNDNNWSNPRTVSVTEDKTFTATFAKNVYSITKNAEHGAISGNNSAEHLDFVTLTVTPDYGYLFTQWSDGNTDNPRTIVLTQDTTFTAEFGIAKSGRCGDNYVLQWVYNSTTKTLTISGIGALSSYYTYGLEAPSEVENLIIEEGVTAIGNSAFSGYTTLKYVSIASSVKTIYDQAFYNCTGLENIYSYREQPSNAYSNSFDGVNKFECSLHVLSASIDMYQAATGWHDFYYIQTIDAKKETEQITSVVVTPAENAAKIAWPINNGAATYTIDISKDGTLVCTLTFNANGQLTGIAFAAPSIRHDAAQETITGYSFTITSLTPGTTYNYSLVAKNVGGTAIDTKNGTFTTLAPTGIEDVLANPSAAKDGKVLHDGQIYILRDGKVYDLTGREIK